ncbi:MAG: excinuclease ABC subunit UvrA [Chitinophagales bacterium]
MTLSLPVLKTDNKNIVQEPDFIEIEGARVHNLKNIDINIPRKKLVVITGISGSGKSSLAFDTIYAEGQRRYLETLSNYARQFLGGLERPDVDKITGLSPVISIEQKTVGKNPRSTVGTITEIYDFLRLLFARASDAYSYKTGQKMVQFSEDQIAEKIKTNFDDKKIVVLAPLVRNRKGHYRELFESLIKKGYLKVRVDGHIIDLEPKMQLDRYKIHDIEAVVDRMRVKEETKQRLNKSIEEALKIGDGLMYVLDVDKKHVLPFSKNLMDADSGLSYDKPSPNSFSFNSPYGMCKNCKGLGFTMQVSEEAMIPDPKLSIARGGLAPIGIRKEGQLHTELKRFAKKYKFSLSEPIQSLPKNVLNVLLYGNEDSDVPSYNEDTDDSERWYTIENGGLEAMLKRSYNVSGADSVKRWAEQFMDKETCPVCEGYRLKKESLFFKINETHIGILAAMNIDDLASWFDDLEKHLSKKQNLIAKDILKEIRARLGFILDVGLDYLSLNRPARSLSGGEAQRIRLATQIGAELSGVTYILDEPSIGLHQRDNQRLINSLKSLTRADNSVIVVEHDKDIMLASDYLIDIGPGAGMLGGEIVGKGTPEEFLKFDMPTSNFLNETWQIETPKTRRKGIGKNIEITGAAGNNLKNLSVKFPLGKFICVTGVSGSGKSTLINETLYPILNAHIYNGRKKPLKYDKIKGLQHIDKVIEIDQSPIGRTPRSNPATYIKLFDDIRKLYALIPEAQIRGYKAGRFSFNVKGGRCEECRGGGKKVIEMNFMPDVLVECPNCQGKRYNRETLEVRYKGKSINDVLEMTVDTAVDFFEAMPNIYRKLKTLQDVGLGYLHLGQSSTTISGGEAQRVKLSSELSKKDTGQTFYILDEPTTGLHFQDIKVLLDVLNKLVDKGNTVLVIEHNMDVVKVADHIIDIGPEGGSKGGNLVVEGTPEQIIKNKESFTAKYLKLEL